MNDDRFKLEKKSFSLIGALLAVLAFLVVICCMNEFGHQRPTSQASKERGTETVINSPSEADVTITPELLSEHTVKEACSLKDLTLNGDDLKAITANTNLRGLKLAGCKFHGPFIPKQSHSSLERISIANSDLDGPLLDYFKQVSSLRALELFTCALQPHSLDSLSDTHIVWLQLRNSRELSGDNSFTAADMASIAKIQSLKHLELERSRLKPDAVQSLKLSAAQVVNLNHCDLTDSDLVALAGMRNVRYIDVSYNPKITYKGIEHLLRAPGIKQIKYDVWLDHLTEADKERLDPLRYNVPRSFYNDGNVRF
ncbi:hypothetical protein BH10CYA1_BH10CYA1_40000 [soil metagenome]